MRGTHKTRPIRLGDKRRLSNPERLPVIFHHEDTKFRRYSCDIGLVMRLNVRYGSMVRTSLSVLGRLTRVQALRQKRQAIDGAANQDAWAQHVAERSMLGVVDPDAGAHQAAWPEAAPIEAPTACVDQRIEGNVSETEQTLTTRLLRRR
jgi:hypothetical protein